MQRAPRVRAWERRRHVHVGRGCRETHLASDGSSSASTSALVDETGRPRGLMTCMFAMELGARGGSGDETVAIPTTMELDSIKQAAKDCGKAGTRFHSPDVRRKRESRKRKFSTRMRSPTHWGGRSLPGDHAPTQGGAMGAVLGVLIRNYGFTDLPPSLPSGPPLTPPPTLRPGHAHPQIKLPPVMSFRKLTGRHRTLWTDTGSAGAARRPAPHLRTALSDTSHEDVFEVSSCVGKLESRLKTQDHKGERTS
jgi:hypothetical protein